MKELFNDRLRTLREDTNMTQAQLGELIGVSERVVGYYEDNRFPKKAEILIKIAEVFNVSIDFLVGRNRRKKVMKQHITSDQFHELREEQRVKLVKWINKNARPSECLMSIGLMISFLYSCPEVSRLEITQWHQGTQKVMVVPQFSIETMTVGKELIYTDLELCDALWEAVKYFL